MFPKKPGQPDFFVCACIWIGKHKLEDITISAPYRSAAEKYGLL
jgi:hypothetical protein